jgi:hypothetical protein
MNAIACRDTSSFHGSFAPSSSVETPSRRSAPASQRHLVPSPLVPSSIFAPPPASSAIGLPDPPVRATPHLISCPDPLRPRIAYVPLPL